MTIKRITFLQELLSFIGLKDRLHLSWISSAEAGKFVDVVNGFTEQIRNLGPNPLTKHDIKPWLEKLKSSDSTSEFTRGDMALTELKRPEQVH